MKKYEETFFKVLMILSALVIMGVLVYIIGTVVYKGLAIAYVGYAYKAAGRWILPWKGRWCSECHHGFGIYYRRLTCNQAIFLSIPVVMYINFYLPKNSVFANIMRFSFDILFGVPSIVYGAFGFALMIYLGIRASLLGGIITVAMLIMPIMMRSLDEVTRLLVEGSSGCTSFAWVPQNMK